MAKQPGISYTRPQAGASGYSGFSGFSGFSGYSGYSGVEFLPQQSQILHVDNNRTDSYTESGTELRPYKTIMAAVNALIALGSTSYITIKIHNGVYQETILLENAALRYVKFEGDGYVSINPVSGNALQSTASNDNLFALHINNVVFAKPIVLTGSNGNSAFQDVIWSNCSFAGTATIAATCINNLSMKNVYSEKNITYVNVNWSYLESCQLQGTFAITMDSTANLPAWGSDGQVLANGVYQSGNVAYTITGVATYAVAVSGCRWGWSNMTVPAGITIFAHNTFLRGVITNNGLIYLRNSSMQGYVAGTGTLNVDGQPASFVKNDSTAVGTTVKDVLDTVLVKNAINGTFTTTDGKTITVANGQITSIV